MNHQVHLFRRNLNLAIALIFALMASIATGRATSPEAPAVVLADPHDPYHVLAQEIAGQESLPLVHSLEEVLAREPVYLLWVTSPGQLSDRALVDFGLAMRDRPSAISTGIITGSTLDDARELWLRASQVDGERVVAANAENPAGNIEAGITTFEGTGATAQPLTRPNLVASLASADYLTFSGHGGKSFLGLAESTKLQPVHLPPLPPAVIATGSCNTFRPWEDDSIALAFVDRGAAAYAGFVYSPNAGYLIGIYGGLPFRYTWPDYPVGHAVQVQNHGTLQGFANFPYYLMLGDPRIALQAEAPYDLVDDRVEGQWRTLTFDGAPAGVIPVRIPGGAGYSFVKIPGVAASWERDPFYNARLQMADIGDDKFLLFEHGGGEFTVQLGTRPPWYWLPADILTDALDGTLLYLQEGGGDLLLLIAGALALIPVLVLLLRKKAPVRNLIPAVLLGFLFALFHGLYALVRLERLTITSKTVLFHPLSLAGTFLLVSCGAFLFLAARSWLGRVVGLLVASLAALVSALLWLGILPLANAILVKPELGTSPWNSAPGWQGLVVLVTSVLLLGLVFWATGKMTARPAQGEE
jgi:hypothetical protein